MNRRRPPLTSVLTLAVARAERATVHTCRLGDIDGCVPCWIAEDQRHVRRADR